MVMGGVGERFFGCRSSESQRDGITGRRMVSCLFSNCNDRLPRTN